jgi:hypothetical protein
MSERLRAVAVAGLGAPVLLKVAVAIAAAMTAMALAALVLSAWWAGSAGAGGFGCEADEVVPLGEGVAPAELVPLFEDAATRYRLGPRGPVILAALTKVESGFGRNMGPSSAGAVGWTQFMPATWQRYGVDADGDGRRDPFTAADAIHASARYLRASGAPGDWHRALFAYNHADWYVERVLREAERLELPGPAAPSAAAVCMPLAGSEVRGDGRIVAIPGSPGESIDVRILRDVLLLQRRFRFTITDGYAATGHAADGEHPLGLAVDVVPGPGGSWDDLDQLARWAEPRQGQPRVPFRYVGYDGDEGHGRGHHLHLSWDHTPTPSRRPPAASVHVLDRGSLP